MERYTVSQFDANTFQVIDCREKREICICANFDNLEDAQERAEKIAALLNQNSELPALTGKHK
ncbi:MAG: hypothetical protein L6461_18745 [Anaerolineae bacterium]|nr:hypothetical protein [Anaerolineae bacterium]